ncbi:MAG TPA: (d)CMP kinase [Bryobacteraceae bacterium]|nr:(d)CMP kinase [Bryobacteraceae bacterium]
MTPKHIIVAIDGPAGAGKTTLAKRVAKKLGFVHINSGAMYRAVALWALRTGTGLDDMHRLEQLAAHAQIEFGLTSGHISLNGEEVTEEIRNPEVSAAASRVSAVPGVRRALLGIQRQIAEVASVVMEGRDIGTVVFPNAHVKIFLDADPRERARRRTLEYEQRGQRAEAASIAAELAERDHRDRTRSEAPLVQAPDAQLVDTTHHSIEEVEKIILRLVRERTSNGKDFKRQGSSA